MLRHLAAVGFVLAAGAPAVAQERVDDRSCWAAFMAVNQAARRTPELGAKAGAGLLAAKTAITGADPKMTQDALTAVLRTSAEQLMTGLGDKSITPQTVMQRANRCESQYGLPVTDFEKYRRRTPPQRPQAPA